MPLLVNTLLAMTNYVAMSSLTLLVTLWQRLTHWEYLKAKFYSEMERQGNHRIEIKYVGIFICFDLMEINCNKF